MSVQVVFDQTNAWLDPLTTSVSLEMHLEEDVQLTQHSALSLEKFVTLSRELLKSKARSLASNAKH